ncbi:MULTISPECIES: response regulator transcription factor [unclassified Actinomyces]|uniref:response regulator n=1 Tax=unclassified Actinomyces TaxID=2609248 RepID=UPI0020177730|nr:MULTISPECIES: response regulator transcription factor [unclassified Actinomyces]MCL3776706.1 response regulator [Actinomyces sp. AC-20-1]MCL3790539.1 response regulator [Actinomyces sp. 187325]MCL3792835.1 response regulator [Actinomyces sp. 186855]MCL3795305.1 response regulator [Actinomyces sp. 217892]
MTDRHPPAARRVVVVDDQELVRASFTMLLEAQPDLEVIATAADGAAALEVLREAVPGGGTDLVLMDLRMPVLDGAGTIRALRADPELAGTRVLVLTTFDDEELVLGALRAGADGYLLKDTSPQVLLEAVRAVAEGGSWLDPAVTGTVLAQLGEPGPAESPGEPGPPSSAAGAEQAGAPSGGPAPEGSPATTGTGQALAEPLTAREEEVLALVCEGLSNTAVGERLHLAESTVKTHMRSLLGKTGCANRVELIVHAYRHALAGPATEDGRPA